MQKPVVSIIAPAINIEYWQELYTMLCAGNSIPFEIVYCGYNRPNFALPENFIYIHSEAKPPQCFETVWRNAIGEFLFIVTDDLVVPPGTIDTLYVYMMRMQNERAIVSARFSDRLEGPAQDNLFCFDLANPRSPVLGCATMTRRKVWEELGGLDRRFNLLWSDTDMQMRILEAGGHPFIMPSENHIVRERPHIRPRLIGDLKKGKPLDKVLLESLWINSDGSTSKNRLDALQPYVANEIPIVR